MAQELIDISGNKNSDGVGLKIEPNNIYLGDCLDLMKYIPDKSIDMILADLPYEITACEWDTVIPFNRHIKEINARGKEIILYRDEYILQEVKKGKSYNEIANYFDNNAIDGLWDNYNRIIKDNGAIVLFGNQPFTSQLINSNLQMFKYEWIWQKQKPTNFYQVKWQPLKEHENILVFYKNKPNYYPIGTIEVNVKSGRKNKSSNLYSKYDGGDYVQKIGNYPRSIIFCPTEGDKDRLHPTQKPVALFEYLIKTYTKEGDTVLDNCIGSGTTAIACINTNRNFIGIEKELKYFEIAKKRIESVTAVQTALEV